jgi:hypothetical protein
MTTLLSDDLSRLKLKGNLWLREKIVEKI